MRVNDGKWMSIRHSQCVKLIVLDGETQICFLAIDSIDSQFDIYMYILYDLIQCFWSSNLLYSNS